MDDQPDTSQTGYVDIHSHILPDLDDGPKSLEGSLALAREARANGVAHIIATPHFNPELFPFSISACRQAKVRLEAALRAEGIAVELHLGAEVRITDSLAEEVAAGAVPTLADSRYLLLELPFDAIPLFAREVVFGLRVGGITPVLAHPERIQEVQRHPALIQPFIESGCLTQINSTSLTGRLGRSTRSTAIEFLTSGWAHIIASDSHVAGERGPNFNEAVALAAKYVGLEEARKLVRDNPGRIIVP